MGQNSHLKKNILKIWVHFARSSSFPEILENAVPLVDGNFQKIKLAFCAEWKALLSVFV